MKKDWLKKLRELAKSDIVAKDLLESIENAETDKDRDDAILVARDYIAPIMRAESEKQAEPVSEPQEQKSEKDSKEIEIDVETVPVQDSESSRPDFTPTRTSDAVLERIKRRQRIAEDNIAKRRNQPITLKEQKQAAVERGKEMLRRNAEIADRRKQLRAIIDKQREERQRQNAKNMVGLLSILERELRLNIRLAVICKRNNFTYDDVMKLKTQNPTGWQECIAIRPKIDQELNLMKL